MKQIMTDIAKNYPTPSAETVASVMDELSQFEPGKVHPIPMSTGGTHPVYIALCESTRNVQANVIALARIIGPGLVRPVKTPEQIEAESIADERKRTSLLLPGSIYAGMSWNGPETKETKALAFMAVDFHHSEKRSALLLGGVGCGKTYAAIGYVGEHSTVYTNGQLNAKFITAQEMLDAIQARKYDLLASLKKVKYLILDDIGTQVGGYKGQDFIAAFEDLFTARHRQNLYTIMTGNISPEEFKKLYGERVASRFNEVGNYFWSDEPDLRMKEAV